MKYLLSFGVVIITVFLINLIWGSGDILKVFITGVILFLLGIINNYFGLGILGIILNLVLGLILFSKFLDIDGSSLFIAVVIYDILIFVISFILVGMFVIH